MNTDAQAEPNLQPLPPNVQEHLVELASDQGSLHQEKAFEILTKLTDAAKSVQAMAQVAVKSAGSAIIGNAIKKMGELQAQVEDWQTDAWEAVEAQLEEREELARKTKQPLSIPWDEMAKALGRADHWAALTLLRNLTDHFDPQVKRVAIDNLVRMLLQPSKTLQSRAIPPEARSVLQGLPEHPDEGIRQVAEDRLGKMDKGLWPENDKLPPAEIS